MRFKKSVFMAILVVLVLSLAAVCSADDGGVSTERNISGNYGVDVYAYIATNQMYMKVDYVYLPGSLTRSSVRAIGWNALYYSNNFDIFLDGNVTITTYYNAYGHCCLAIIVGDAVK